MDNQSNTSDELELALQARQDADAFDTLYRRYVTQVYRYCYARTNLETEAEDLTAQVFLAALESIDRFQARGSFAAWLFGIASRKCADYYRSQYADRNTPLDTTAQHADPEAVDPEAKAIDRGFLECILRMLPHLSPDRAEVLHLRYWGGLNIREITTLMQRSESAVKMLVSRALADLRERCLYEQSEPDRAYHAP